MSTTRPQRLSNDFVTAPGYERVSDILQPRIRLALHHRGQLWVLSSTVESDMADSQLLGTVQKLRPLELASVGFAVLWHAIQLTVVGKATNFLRTIRYRLSMNAPDRNR